jgi:hypothetical protein
MGGTEWRGSPAGTGLQGSRLACCPVGLPYQLPTNAEDERESAHAVFLSSATIVYKVH